MKWGNKHITDISKPLMDEIASRMIGVPPMKSGLIIANYIPKTKGVTVINRDGVRKVDISEWMGGRTTKPNKAGIVKLSPSTKLTSLPKMTSPQVRAGKCVGFLPNGKFESMYEHHKRCHGCSMRYAKAVGKAISMSGTNRKHTEFALSKRNADGTKIEPMVRRQRRGKA